MVFVPFYYSEEVDLMVRNSTLMRTIEVNRFIEAAFKIERLQIGEIHMGGESSTV